MHAQEGFSFFLLPLPTNMGNGKWGGRKWVFFLFLLPFAAIIVLAHCRPPSLTHTPPNGHTKEKGKGTVPMEEEEEEERDVTGSNRRERRGEEKRKGERVGNNRSENHHYRYKLTHE